MLLVVGTIGIDGIETPRGSRSECLGGSAIHFAFAASIFGPVRVLGVVGEDFSAAWLATLRERGIDTAGIEVARGKTFRWAGKYFDDMDRRETLLTELNVFDGRKPAMPPAWRDTGTVFLANASPRLQLDVLAQITRPDLVVCDTMDLWIRTEREDLELLLRRVNGVTINESEATLFTREPSLLRAGQSLLDLGPEFVVIKKGTHGSLLHPRRRVRPARLPRRPGLRPDGRRRQLRGRFPRVLARAPGPRPREAQARPGICDLRRFVQRRGLRDGPAEPARARRTRGARRRLQGHAVDPMSMRTFIAVEIPPEVRTALGRTLGTLKARIAGVRWSRPENIHVTLRFLGEVDDRSIPEVAAAARAAARRTAPFELKLGGPAGFGGSSPRVLLLAIGGQSEALVGLAAALEDELDERGFGREGRAFRPHLTLGRRGRSDVPESWRDLAQPPPAAWDVDELCVFSSELTPQGPIYTPLARCPLGSEEDAADGPKTSS